MIILWRAILFYLGNLLLLFHFKNFRPVYYLGSCSSISSGLTERHFTKGLEYVMTYCLWSSQIEVFLNTASSHQGHTSISASGPKVHGCKGVFTDFSDLAAGLMVKSKSTLCIPSFAFPVSVQSLISLLLC